METIGICACAILAFGGGAYFGRKMTYRKQESQIVKKNNELLKFRKLFSIVYGMLILQRTGQTVASVLKKAKIGNVAVYGMGKIGQIIIDDCQKEGINVTYVVDRQAKDLELEIPVYAPEDDWPSVEMLLLTMADNCEVKEKVKDKVRGQVWTIEDFV